MSNYFTSLVADNFYHVFNRAIGNEKLFLAKDNYRYFFQKMEYHILPVADLFAYSLLPNHFHLLIRIKPHETLTAYFKLKKGKYFNGTKHDMSDFLMERFSNWLNGYTKAFNKMYDRKGGLFIDYTKRIEARKETDISSFILYIHQNAVHHGLTKEIGQWPFDSYQAILGGGITSLMRNEVIQWYGSKQNFIDFHKQPVHLKTHKVFDNLMG